MTMPSAHQSPSPPYAPPRRGAPEGLRAISGLVAGVVGGAIGAVISVVLAKNDNVLDAKIAVQYLAILGSYGAALGAVLLATNAAKREHSSVVGSFLVGAILGGVASGLGSMALIRVIVEPVLRRNDDPKQAFMIAVALILGALGLCLGLAVGLLRGAYAMLTAVAGAVMGAIGGAAYVEFVLFSDRVHSQSDVDTAAMLTLTATGAAIGLAIGAIGRAPAETPVYGHAHSGIWAPIATPPVESRPSLPRASPRVDAPTAPPAWTPAPVAAPTPPPMPPVEAPPIPAPTTPVSEPRFALRLDDGGSYAIHQRVIVGRAPQRVSRDDSDAVLVNIDDGPTMAPDHFAITWHDGRLLVEDLSGAGTTVVSPSGVQTRIGNSTPMQVGDGWVVMFGARRAQVLWV